MKKKLCILLANMIILTLSAQTNNAYVQSIRAWDQQRVRELVSEKGWLNIIALFWIDSGVQSFGSRVDNTFIILEGNTPYYAGQIDRTDNKVFIQPNTAGCLSIKNKEITERTLVYSDTSTEAPTISLGSLRLNIIRKDDKLALLVRNLVSKQLSSFEGLERYTIDETWKVPATLTRVDNGNPIVQFILNNQTYQVQAEEHDKEFIIHFKDKTAGSSTNIDGRYISIDKNEVKGKFYLDFNKAYNPPSAFTPLAPIKKPKISNILPFEVKAGEKLYNNQQIASVTY